MTKTKRIFAIAMAATMVLGSSMTVLADNPSDVSQDGTGTYEGNLPSYGAPSITMPTIAAGTFNYTADPNELIERTSAAAHTGDTFTGNGIYFLTAEHTYTANSKPMEVKNNSAYSCDITVVMSQKTAGKNVAYSTDNTFADSTSEEIYLALTDGTNTAAMSQKKEGTAVTVEPATLRFTLNGKPSNYEIAPASSGGYEIKAKSGLTDDSWNKSSVVATGALNKIANWAGGTGEDAITFPEITVTYKLAYGAAPVFIKNGVAKDVALAHKGASVTIKDIKYGTTVVPANMYEATAIDASKGATLTLKEAFTAFAYGKVPADGLVFTVTYSDDFQETFTVVK